MRERLLPFATAAVALALPLLLFAWLWRRKPILPARALTRSAVLAALLVLPLLFAERWTMRLAGLSPGQVVPPYIALGLWGPLAEGFKLLALWPSFRRRELRGPLEGTTAAALVSVLFAAENAVEPLRSHATPTWPVVVSILIAAFAEPLISSPWAFVLGRSYTRSYPRPGFLPAWLSAVVLHGVLDHLLSRREPRALLAALPLLAGLLLLAFLARDRLLPGDPRPLIRRTRGAPALQDLQKILSLRDAHLNLRWVLVGLMVHQGSLVLSLVTAVVLGNVIGVDFASVDATSSASLGPVIFLLLAALGSFPVAGFLIARGSGVPTLLEPALASVLALVALAIVVGATTPIALAVVLACAPVAIVLCCAGAWLGLR